MILLFLVAEIILNSSDVVRQEAENVLNQTVKREKEICKAILNKEIDLILDRINADENSVLIKKEELENLKLKIEENEQENNKIKNKYEEEKKALEKKIKELEGNKDIEQEDTSTGTKVHVSVLKHILTFICTLILLILLFFVHYLLLIYSCDLISKYNNFY